MTEPTPPRSTVWKSIADALMADLGNGHYRPGDKLPTEAALAARFGVNRHTVRHALGHLAAGGLVHARRGSGVFVASAPADYALGRRVRFHQNMAAAGRVPSRELLRLETRHCDADEAAALHLTPGDPVHVCEGLSLADGVPMASFRSVFSAARFPGMLDALRDIGSITQALASQGVADYTRASTRLTAQSATAAMALHLRLVEGAPILQSVAVNVGPGGEPVEYGTTWFAGDRVTLTLSPEPA